jgi:O-antigen/teichoic acid export membrane protein
METFDLQEIKSKTTTSVLFLSLRNIGIQAIQFIGFSILAWKLDAQEIGIYGITLIIISLLSYFSDIGLAAALIKEKEEVGKEELQTTFLIQQILVAIGLIIFYLLKHDDPFVIQNQYLIIALCFSFVCASLKTIPSVLLERKLNFKILSTIDIVENLCFFTIAVFMALLGFGVNSFTIAIVVRSLLGLIIIYRLSPWSIGLKFSRSAAKKLFKFGIPFQFNSLIALIKDQVPRLLVANQIGAQGFGILTFAEKGPRAPLSFMDAIQRVTFPTFARMQDQKEILTASIKKSIFFIAFFIFPTLTGIALIAPNIIQVIERYNKWQPAIIPIYLYCISFAIAAITTPLTNAFNATGKILTTTKLMIMWTILTWIFYPILSIKFGFIGTAYAALIVGSSSIVAWIIAQKMFNFNTIVNIAHPLIASLLMIFLLTPLNIFVDNHIFNIILKIIFGSIIYCIYQWIFSKQEILWFVKQVKCNILKK